MTGPGDDDYRDFGGAYADPVTGEMIGGDAPHHRRPHHPRPADPAPYDTGAHPGQSGTPYTTDPYPAQPPYDQTTYPGQPPYNADPYPGQAPYDPAAYSGQAPFDPAAYPGQPPFDAAPYPGGFTAPPPPRRTGSLAIRLAVVVGAVVVLIALGAVYFLVGGNRTGGTATGSPTTPTKTGQRSGSAPTSAGPSTTAATVPGWQGVLSTRDGLAYDVPPTWRVGSADTIVGFERPDPKAPYGYSPFIAGHAAAEFAGGCTENGTYRAQTAVLSAGDLAPDRAAGAAAARWTQGATMAKNGAMHPLRAPASRPLRLADGTTAAQATITDTTQDTSGRCLAPKVAVTAVAVPTRSGTAVLIVSADNGVPDAEQPATLTRIAESVRQAK